MSNLTEKLNDLLSNVRPQMIEVVFDPSQKNISELCLALGQNRPEGADHYEHILCTSILLGSLKSAKEFKKGIGFSQEDRDTLFQEYTEKETTYFLGVMQEKELLMANDILV